MMNLKEQVNQNIAASQQVACTPSGCKACQRKGSAIFPLRVAAVPKTLVNPLWRPAVPKQTVDLNGGEFKYALRTLRMGYLYVLLDRTVWQVYEVTPEGCLRQFNAPEMPEAETVTPLAESCRTANHDVNASFINIDNSLYSEVWLAFSRDPWSQEVLASYQCSSHASNRFTKITLTKEGQVSGENCMALDPTLSTLKSNVVEFATDFFPNVVQVDEDKFGGAHGFYPRMDKGKQNALSCQVSQIEGRYGCKVMAVSVNDAVGIIQELNNARMQLVETIQAYTQQPGISHKHVISEAIVQYLDKIKKDIAAVSQPRSVPTGPAVAGCVPKVISKEEVAEETFARQYARLLKSYDEPARATFAKEFRDSFTWPQERLKTVDQDLAAWYQSELWLKILTNDYAPDTCAASWGAQMNTIAACVQGGALSKATEGVWLSWLKKPDSPAYIGFTGMKTSMLAAVFNGANVYSDLKVAATADEFGNYLKRAAIRRGWASRMLAVSASVSRLGKSVDAATRKSYLAMTQAAMLTAGESTVVLEYETTFRKLKQHLKNNAALRQSLAVNNATFKDIGYRGGSALVVDELMGMRGKALDTPVRVQYSIPGTLEEIRTELPHLDVTKGPFNNPAMVSDTHDLFISDLSLQGKGQTGTLVKASYAQLAQWNERGMRLISGDSVGLIFGAGLMALQVANWHDLTERLHNSMGTDVDVIADISINSLLFIEGFTELTGFASKLAIKQNWVVLSKAQQVPTLVRFGAVLGGIAAVVDGIRNGIHGWEAYKTGDTGATVAYGISAMALIASGVISGWYGAYGVFALTSTTGLLGLGPAGWAALLIIAGIMLAYTANELRTTAFENWLRRTCFGIRDHNFNAVVWEATNPDDLADAVVEYRAIVSGMVADVAFASALDIFTGNPTIQGVDYQRVDFRVAIPGWVEGRSARSLTLSSGSAELFSESSNVPGIENHHRDNGPEGYYKYAYRVDGSDDKNGKMTEPKSLSIVVSTWVAKNRMPEVTLEAEFWPDKADPEYKLGLTLSAKRD
ncbi:hypothetical protein CWI88_10785 [Enterobacter cancerogenus]|uniref:T6SS effector BTH_I2691 family protein n=1 Tax=Enterobacter cancerogenus TaxID=69218 RepID=UPI000C7856B6|nr:T6SS effector BTH_I2691 family protein [Enterobacter cancerogenus]AUJ81499.1 hypothetical protein CWI88_10785 [Enterobacter cancerogenus]